MPKYLKKVGSKIKDMVNHHKKLKRKNEEAESKEEFGLRNTSEEENHKYAEYLSNSQNFMSSEKYNDKFYEDSISKAKDHTMEKEYFSNGDGMGKVIKERKKEDNLTDHAKSPTFLNVESQYLEKDNNNESSQFKPRALEFEKTSNFSSNFNSRYNNLNNNNININNLIESSGSKKRTENNFNELAVKKEQSKMLGETTKEFEINRENFKYTGGFLIKRNYFSYFLSLDTFNEKESSVSSNFSMFQPNEELKSFYQKELWNNHSFQKKAGLSANFIRADDDSDDEGLEE